jgi:hypothetical protein
MQGNKTRSEIMEQHWVEFLNFAKSYNDELIAEQSKAKEEQRPEERRPFMFVNEQTFWQWVMDNKLKDTASGAVITK